MGNTTNSTVDARQGEGLRVPVLSALFVALVTFGITFQPAPDSAPGLPSTFDISAEPGEVSEDLPLAVDNAAIQEALARAKFYDDSVVPLIERVEADNRVAAQRCIQRLDALIDQYHCGVDVFVDEMTSISTRLGILKRMPGGWWASDGRVEQYVQQKFEANLFSEESLTNEVTLILMQFRGDIDANQRRMLAGVHAALSLSDFPDVTLESHEEFFHTLSVQLNKYATEQGVNSVENMMGALVLGEVGAFAARALLAGLLARFAPTVVVSTAAGASATAGASAAGAGGGSLGGPVGTVVGFGAGLAVGLIIDWWMTERFEAELGENMHAYLDDLRNTLVQGSAAVDDEGVAQANAGLQYALDGLCERLTVAYRDLFFNQIVQRESS